MPWSRLSLGLTLTLTLALTLSCGGGSGGPSDASPPDVPAADAAPPDPGLPADEGGGTDVPSDPGTPDEGEDDPGLADGGLGDDDPGPEDAGAVDAGIGDPGATDLSEAADGPSPVCLVAGDCPATGDACRRVDCVEGKCVPANAVDGTACDDGNPCTADSCDTGTCKGVPIEGCVAEVCDNLADDNENGLIDCDDPHCLTSTACDLPGGDFCAKALPVNDGKAVDRTLAGQTLTYPGDTTGRRHDYQGGCTMPAEVPDAVYRLDLAEPLRVTVSHDFDSVADQGPASVVILYADACRPDSQVDCASGGTGAAVIERTLPAGTWYIVADGESFWDKHWGPYTLRISFAVPPSTETDCTNDVDDDADSWTDCVDPDCAGVAACQACPIVAEVACGDTVTGTLASADHEMHYRFKAPKAETVYFVGADTGVYTDYLNFNFYEFQTGKACDELYNVGVMVTHVQPNTAYFATKAGQDIVIKVLVTNHATGAFSFSIACGVAPEAACSDGKDDDMDGYVDCEDFDCFRDDACTGGHSGETCADPYPVNGGAAVSAATAGPDGVTFTYWNTTEGRGKDLAATCSAASSTGRDTVYRFSLSDRLSVGVMVENEDFLQNPVVYVFSGACTADGLLGCGRTIFGLASWGETLDAGTYFAVVDAGAIGVDGIPDASNYAIGFTFENPAPSEDCGNGKDEDGDGKTDCQDPGCFEDAACTGGHSGETCADPIPLNAGAALVSGTTHAAWNTTIGASDDLSGSCSVHSEAGPDRVHRFSLAQAATVTVTVQFDNGFTPALTLFRGTLCGTADLLDCVVAEWDTATVTRALEAGEYRVVVDSGDALFAEPMAQDYVLTVQVQ